MLKKLSVVIFILMSFISGKVFASQEIAMIVNDDLITKKDFLQRKELFVKLNDFSELSSADHKKINELVVDNIVTEIIVKTLAEGDDIAVSEQELNSTIENIAKNNGITLEQLKEHLNKKGVNFEDFKTHQRKEALKQKFFQEALGREVAITKNEVNKFITSTPTAESSATYLLFKSSGKGDKHRQSMLGLASNLNRYKCVNVPESLYRNIAEMQTMEGIINDLQLSHKSLIRNMKAGEVSKVVKSKDGFEMIMLCNIKLPEIEDNAYNNIAVNLYSQKISKEANNLINKLRSNAYIVINKCIDNDAK